ncbi:MULTISPECIES: hypothetical protein [unclassified Pseudoalteromonas]|uniref:hypothetical protein n=1 Tax=unclassified Pseudoalteromonas TaxID=194690 RepID=UPI000463FAEA|nr:MULTISPECIES: hypothetical protein [unclassified Pseudoalteromonas]
MKKVLLDENSSKFKKERDLKTVIVCAVLYTLCFFINSEITTKYAGLAMVHMVVLFMCLHKEKPFGFDILPKVIPLGIYGLFTYASIVSSAEAQAKPITEAGNIFLWLFMGMFPIIVQRAIRHIMVAKYNSDSDSQND